MAVAGTIRPPPAFTELRMRVADLDLAPWARLLPVAARVTGLAQADLRIDEPIAADVPARIQGPVAVSRLGVSDDRQERLGARRVEARDLELHWPERLMVGRVLVSGPRGVVERDRDGGLPLKDLLAPRPAPTATRSRGPDEPPGQPLAVEVGEIRVQDGAVAWRDEAVSPPTRLSVSGVNATVTGAGWPMRGPLGVRAALQPPGGGQLSVSGRVALDPLAADLRVIARNAELAPYHPYLATPARVSGAADLDVAVVVPSV
ncbi:MAG TPA: DUF748 domain-containing protein, partial [Candidatus Limnocylindrales bacterium]|nr:DUF748 domain-containing protein [Candidatus Limnocylindrales bacterium]